MRHHLLALSALVLSAQAAHAQVTTWTRVAIERQSFTLNAARTVRYGSASSWVTKSLAAGTWQCTNEFFGKDPLPWVTKECQVSSAPAPAPAPSPAPAPAPAPLPAPPCTCTPTGTSGTAILTWTPPPVVGTGYRVHYGTAPGVYSQAADVTGGGSTTYTVTNLQSGKTFFFCVGTVDSRIPAESLCSNEVSKLVP